MSDLLATDNPFTAAECDTLREILKAMIPAQGPRPGADDEPIFADILHTAKPAVATVRQVIQQAQTEGVEAVADTQSPAVRALVGIVVQCYYRDDRVMRSIGMAPRAPHPEGFELAADDWSLLHPVSARGSIYREV